MSRTYSFPMQNGMASDQTDELPVLLVKIDHPNLSEPAYLSSDPTHQITLEPYVRGTRHQGTNYLFVRMDMVLPDDQDRAPPRATLVLDNVDVRLGAVLRSFTSPADVELRLVLASTPDHVEAEYIGLFGTRSSCDINQVSLDISREPLTSEPWPAGRFGRLQFPTLHN